MSNNFGGIVLDENVIALWHFEFDGGNFLSALRKNPSGGMEHTSRFRYYYDDKPGPDSQDEKVWYRGNLDWTEARAVNVLREVNTKLARYAHGILDEILMDETGYDGLLAKIEKRLPCWSVPIKAYSLPIQRAVSELLTEHGA